ncbi:MAG: DUF512 domain-containing protein [Clostridia bacterium]|nr:DUF512 domain-containing protein [Clostridia bacterium]
MAVKITGIDAGSPAQKKRIAPGDTLLTVNGREIRDVLDYRFYLNDCKLRLTLLTAHGRRRTVTIRKEETADIGLQFETYLMDRQRSCRNNCVFCFIDQLPAGLRESLYFKDDDARLSFLFGNYITLTNLTDAEADRIIEMHISPVNVSVHTMDPVLRVQMMKNRFAGEALRFLRRFADAGIAMNTQLVLCPGINDGPALAQSLDALFALYPAVQSVAAVPVGLTDHREGLTPLTAFTPETAAAVIDLIDEKNAAFRAQHGETIAYAADEFYLKAGRPMPGMDYYNDFPQLENGVGMWTLMRYEFDEALAACNAEVPARTVTCVTGTAAFPLISALADAAMRKFPQLTVRTVQAENRLFGSRITVSGLLCGADIAAALQGRPLGDGVIIPPNCLKSDEDIFLDDMTVPALEERLGVPVIKQENGSGAALLHAMIGGA